MVIKSDEHNIRLGESLNHMSTFKTDLEYIHIFGGTTSNLMQTGMVYIYC